MKLKNKLQKTRKILIITVFVSIITIAFLFLLLSNHLVRIRKDHLLYKECVIKNNI